VIESKMLRSIRKCFCVWGVFERIHQDHQRCRLRTGSSPPRQELTGAVTDEAVLNFDSE
jgi:hypothetical protein